MGADCALNAPAISCPRRLQLAAAQPQQAHYCTSFHEAEESFVSRARSGSPELAGGGGWWIERG